MAEDKKKSQTKKALLGELESIRTLLEDSEDDTIDFGDDLAWADALDPPMLTATIEPEISAAEAEDIPILTEAFDSVIADIEADAGEDAEIADTENEQNSARFQEPEFEQWPETADIEADHSLDSDDSGETESTNSIFDDLEMEFEQQFQDDEDNSPTHTGSNATHAKDKEKTTAKLAEEKIQREPEKKSHKADSNRTVRKHAEPAAIDKSKTKDEPISRKRDKRQTQPSLFDTEEKPPTPELTTTAATPGASKTNSTAATSRVPTPLKSATTLTPNKLVNSENPFLPKHIRDRLHTSRSLQDELTSINNLATIATSTSTSPTSGLTPGSDSSLSSSNTTATVQEQLIDKLVAEYLPKIEQELRKRLHQQLSKQTNEKTESP